MNPTKPTTFEQEIAATAEATRQNVRALLDSLPAGWRREALDAGPNGSQRWDYNDRAHARLVTTPEDGIDVHKFTANGNLLVWSAHFDSGTPAAIMRGVLEKL